VAHRQGREALPPQEVHQLPQDPALGDRVQGAGGLVQEEELGLPGQGPGQGHPLPLPAGEGLGALVGVLQKAHPL
jgi:hypothetical protein